MSGEGLGRFPLIHVGIDLLLNELAECLSHLPVLICVDGLLSRIHPSQQTPTSAERPHC